MLVYRYKHGIDIKSWYQKGMKIDYFILLDKVP